MSETVLSRRALNRATLARQMLLRRESITPVAAVERLAGMQAQVPKPPFIGLWSRLEGFQREDLVRALARHDIIRATLMRGTLHLMSRTDFVSFRAALQPMLSAGMQSVLGDRTSGIDLKTLIPAARACFETKPCTFDVLRKHLSKQFPDVDERAMGYIVRTHLPLIQMPVDAVKWAYPASADFAVAESRLGEPFGADVRPHALVLRYFAAFGPASVDDVQTWSYLRDLQTVVDDLRPKLRMFKDERGRELFDLPAAPRPDEQVDVPVRFLPEFDNLLLSHADRTRVLANDYRPAIFTKNLRVLATFLVDGFVAGTWTVERKKASAALDLEPFIPLTKAVRRELEEEGERLLRFVEDDVEKVDVRVGGVRTFAVAETSKGKASKAPKAPEVAKIAKSMKIAKSTKAVTATKVAKTTKVTKATKAAKVVAASTSSRTTSRASARPAARGATAAAGTSGRKRR